MKSAASGEDDELSHWTISSYLMANGVRLARLLSNGPRVVEWIAGSSQSHPIGAVPTIKSSK